MKTRFNTYDLICSVAELQRAVGMRVNQVYDIDNKTYLIRLHRGEEKLTLMMESGSRIHSTAYDWPKNNSPSGFTMKLRKHLKNKRLESLSQIGVDRIVDLQFGSGDAAYHVLLEMFDKGNIVLTDKDHITLNLLRPHTEHETYKFAVREKYPLDRAKQSSEPPPTEELEELMRNAKKGDNLKKLLNPRLEFGPALTEHCLLEVGLSGNLQISTASSEKKCFNPEKDLELLVKALAIAKQMFTDARNVVSKGYVIQKKEERPPAPDKPDEPQFLVTNQEFNPFLYHQHQNLPHAEYITFDQAIDDFFSTLEGQKADMKIVQVEREAMKKLSNVRKDHVKRVSELEVAQDSNRNKAELIARNQDHVEKVILALNIAIASQTSWSDIETWVSEAKSRGDPIAKSIHSIKFNTNHVSLQLSDPYVDGIQSGDNQQAILPPVIVDVDLNLSAYANARRYYDQKKAAAKKQQKTVEAQSKAMKSAEKKTKQTLKEAQTIGIIHKARKVYWFEKFYWFISSDNYLVIGGRDRQQNELLVKRYLRNTDIYVHADVFGASSVIIKNPTQNPIPARTLDEAGLMAVAYSGMWESQVPSASWWVHGSQVSKTPPAGQYLSAGSFMIRGKKNYLLPPARLALGFSFMFRLEDESMSHHIGERKSNATDSVYTPSEISDSKDEDTAEQDINVSSDSEGSDDETNNTKNRLKPVIEEEDPSDKPDQNLQSLKETESEYTPTSTATKEDTKVVKDPVREDAEENNDADSEEQNSDEDTVYPETHIKVEHDTGKIVMTRTDTVSSDHSVTADDIISRKSSCVSTKSNNNEKTKKEETKKLVDQPKRGQRSKLKKIKDKYKDQDDEDREHMMLFLQSAGSGKPSKKAQRKSSKEIQQQKTSKKQSKGGPYSQQPVIVHLEEELPSDNEEQDENEQQSALADVEMLNQLTGCPHADDELIFAVPVVAPYTALLNYKYKVKMITGGSKRGKAARAALQLFLREKSALPREKDLLRAVKDEDLARNFPGKVKLSMPAKR